MNTIEELSNLIVNDYDDGKIELFYARLEDIDRMRADCQIIKKPGGENQNGDSV